MNTVQPSETSCTAVGLHCEIYGSGDPVLCLHGLGASTYTWRNFIEPLKKSHKLILIDLKGFGSSPKPRDKRYSIQDHADLIYQFILEHDLNNLTLIGNSYGGAVALQLAIRLCEEDRRRLAKLILIGSVGYNQSLPWHLKLLRTPFLGWLSVHVLPAERSVRTALRYSYYQGSLITREQIRAYAKAIGSRGGRYALLHTIKQAIPKDVDELTARYKTICVPTLLLWGEADRVIPFEIGKMLNEAIPNSKLVLIEKAGHVPHEEVPENTVPPILEFLKTSPAE